MGVALRVGAAVADITPPLGLAMAGYRRPRQAAAVHDPLQVGALVLDDGGARVALVGLDLLCINAEQVRRARELIEEHCGIPPERVMCWATHAHTGPVTDANTPAGDPDPAYLELLPERIARCVEEASGRLQPAQGDVGRGHLPDIAFNRRADRRGRPLPRERNELLDLLREGRQPQVPRLPEGEWLEAASVVDPQVGVLHARGVEGGAPVVWVNFALHCDTVGGEEYSAGYPHALRSALRKAWGDDAAVLFANGPCGDINHVDRRRAVQKGFAEAERVGAAMAAAVSRLLRDGTGDAAAGALAPLDAERAQIHLRRRAVHAEELELARAVVAQVPADKGHRERYYADDLLALDAADPVVTTEIQAVRLGSTAIVALPGEIFVELGLEIKRRSPFRHTFVVELANDYVGYVPTQEAFDEGGYEVMTARTSRLAPEAGSAMVAASLGLLERLAATQ